MIPTIRIVLVIIGVVTMYRCDPADPLRCGGSCLPTSQWVAADIDALPYWECGDEVVIWSNGTMRTFQIQDSGPLSLYYVDWPGAGLLPIALDIPSHTSWFPGLSTRAQVANASLARRILSAEQ